jgi:hypothetical protein
MKMKDYQVLVSDVNKIESSISQNINYLCGTDAMLTRMTSVKNTVAGKLSDLKLLSANIKDKITTIVCDVTVLYEKSVDLSNMSVRIAEYLNKIIDMINRGLLVAGENVEIEYIDGFAKIHARIPDYEPRKAPPRDCFDSAPIELTFPAPACPPVVPGCPTCPDVTTTAAPATTTAAATTTFEFASHFFIKQNHNNVLDVMRQLDFNEVKFNTAGNPSVASSELVYLYSKLDPSKSIDLETKGFIIK